jgi:exopolysaccharide production protein ExoZ
MWSVSAQFELSRHGDAQNVRPMEGLRGFAVFLVFLVHYVTLVSPWITRGSWLDAVSVAIHTIGNAGVDLFFVLSGYLIYGSMMARPQGFVRFMRRRVARIYPAFCVVFGLYLLLSFAYPAESKIPSRGLEAGTYILQNFLLLPGLFDIDPMITVAWSLSYEMFYYLAIPLTITFFRLRDRSIKWRVWFFLAGAAAIAAYCSVYGGHVRLIMFIAGILLHEAIRDGSIPAPRSSFALAMLAAGLIATTMPFTGAGAFTVKIVILSCTFFVVCYSCFSRPASWLALRFSWTPLRWLGNMSYSYYLLHGLALKVGFMVFAKVPTVTYEALFFIGLMPLMFVITLLPTASLFLLVERPLSLKPALRRQPATVAAPVPGPNNPASSQDSDVPRQLQS